MSTKQNNNGLIVAIIFAALVIGGSLVFFATQQAPKNTAAPSGELSDDAIARGIERYVQLQQEQQEEAQRLAEQASLDNFVKPKDDEYRKGPADALLTVVEYTDFECPFCKSFHNSMNDTLEKRDDVNWITRHFPLGFHDPIASEQAMISECVGTIGGGEAFWEFADKLFERTASNKGITYDAVVALAEEVVGDSDDLDSCIANQDGLAKLNTDKKEGAAAGVTGTPSSFIVNNKTGAVVKMSGAVPAGQIEALLDQAASK